MNSFNSIKHGKSGEFSTSFGFRMKEIRLRKGMTLFEVGAFLNVQKSLVRKLEIGMRNIQIKHLPAYSEAFDISIPDLLDFDKKVSDLINPVHSLSQNIT